MMKHDDHINQIRTEPIYAILGETFSRGRTNRQVAKALLGAGVRIIQYREKKKSWQEKYEEARDICQWCNEYGATFIMNDSIDLAIACEAPVIHVGQDDAPVAWVRRLAQRDIVVGVSTHTIAEMKKAVRDGADYVGLGPMYQTTSKMDVHDIVADVDKAYALTLPIPVVTIGGIDLIHIRQLYTEGFRSFAMISALVGATDIVEQIGAFRQVLQEKIDEC